MVHVDNAPHHGERERVSIISEGHGQVQQQLVRQHNCAVVVHC
jgi:hypothetical protein